MNPLSPIRAAGRNALAPCVPSLVVWMLLAAAGKAAEENPRLLPTQPAGAWTLQWDGRPGRTYFVQQSHDLRAWTYINTLRHGSGVHMLGAATTGSRYFLRLRHTDIPCEDPATADFDDDGLSNADELLLLTDPFLADSDTDGFRDGWEVLAGMDPIQNNANQAHLDPDNDGWDNATEYLYNTNPNLADSDGDELDDPDDADPNDETIDWPRAPEATRVWIPLEGYDSSTHGAPVALSNTGIALFEKAIWKAGVWKNLEWEKVGPGLSIPDGPNGPEVLSTTLRAIRALDLADDGRVLGKAELLFSYPYGGGHGAPGTSENAVQWTEDTHGTLVMELTGLNVGEQIDMATYWSLPKPAGVSPDGFLFTERSGQAPAGSGGSGGMAAVSGMEWWRPVPTQWKGPDGDIFTQTEGLEWMRFETLGGVWMQARNTVLGGKMGVMRDGTGSNQIVNRLLEGTAPTVLPNGAGYVCGSLADNRVAFVSAANGVSGLHLRPAGNTLDFRPVPKLAGTAAFNARGEAISHDGRFWQNGKWLAPVSEGNAPPDGTMHLHDLNDHGVMLATAGEDASASETGPQYGVEAGFVVPVGFAVDADRNREIDFGIDKTSTDTPFIFWTNDDQDDEEDGEAHLPSAADSSNGSIDTMRDLEDFARLHVDVSSLPQYPNGELRIGFKWESIEPGGDPGIKIYFSADPEGTDGYLRDPVMAQGQITGVYAQSVANVLGSDIVWLSGPDTSRIPFDRRWTTLFEGVSNKAGKGRLNLVLEVSGNIVTGPGVWLDLQNVRTMYQRAKGTPEAGLPPPWENCWPSGISYVVDPNGHPFRKPWWEKEHAVFLVHGIHGPGLDLAGGYNANVFVANTFYKRLWWAGFTGRLCFYKWPAFDLTKFNQSEWRAYNYGAGLTSYIQGSDGAPTDYSRHVVAHSQGNAVMSAAVEHFHLRPAKPMTWISLQGAIPSNVLNAAWETSEGNAFTVHNALSWQQNNPDHWTQLGYRGWVDVGTNQAGEWPANLRMVNFVNYRDIVTSEGWLLIHWTQKPSVPIPGVAYNADANGPLLTELDGLVLNERRVENRFESLAMVARTRTNSLGQESRVGGKIRTAIDIDSITNDKGHGTQWDLHIQSKGTNGLGTGILPLFEKMIQETDTPTTYEYP